MAPCCAESAVKHQPTSELTVLWCVVCSVNRCRCVVVVTRWTR